MNERARVPFALVGVVLLVGSVTFAATLSTRAPPPDDPATERAIERTTAATTTALRAASTRAADRAARHPVTSPGNTSAGTALNASTTFRDYLRVRVYLTARTHLRSVGQVVDGVRTTVSLPPVPNATALRRAKGRVLVERAGPNGTAMRVRVENVTITARRNGHVVERVRVSPTFVVDTPALAVHDRVRRFERRLDAGPTEPGLSRGLTARLYPIAWARGYAQYGGAPISNVIANRHVELATNGALLAAQRTAFGSADPAGRRGFAAAAGRVAVTDVLTAAGARRSRTEAVLRAAERVVSDDRIDRDPIRGLQRGAPSPNDQMRVGVNRSADVGFVGLVNGNLTDVLRTVYSARVRPDASVEHVDTERTGDTRPPEGWTLADERRDSQVRVTKEISRGQGDVDAEREWHVLRAYGRRVVRETTTVRTWRRDGRTRTTRVDRIATYRVTVSILGRHAPGARAPQRTIRTVHRRGAGPLDGPNLAGVEQRAVERLVAGNGGPDGLARRAVGDSLDTSPRTVRGERPDGLRRWIVRDLVALRNRVRTVSVGVERGAVGTHSANAPAELAGRLDRRRADLLDVPTAYGSVAGKARAAARAAYLDRVVARLERRAARQRRERSGLRRALRDRGLTLADIERALRGRRGGGWEHRAGSDRNPNLSVDGAPPYLTLAEVSRERAGVSGEGTVRPLAARNLNVFTVPYGDAAGTVVDRLFDTRLVHLRTAARTLQAARLANGSLNGTIRVRRTELRRDVRRSVGAVSERLRGSLRRSEVGGSTAERREIVRAGLSRWDTVAGRALALTNGSAVRAVVAEAAERDERFAGQPERTRLRVRLGVSVGRALSAPPGRVSQPIVNRTESIVKAVASESLGRLVERGRNRWARSSLGSLPAGLPVTPAPGNWYATVNVWHVQVRGGYERFTVRAKRGQRSVADATLAYTRAGEAVRLDVDDDGRPELLGRGERVSFETGTVVVVVVPPGGRGVGDTDGNADERSPGWKSGR